MHVQYIVLATVDLGGGFKNAQATVTVVDSSDNPVSGVEVTGTFTGDLTQTVTETTNGGLAVLTTTTDPAAHGRLKFTFCVDDVVDASDVLGYDNTANDCDSN